MTTTVKLALELLQNNAANQTLANLTFAQINQLIQGAVVDKDLSSPPGSPANEALYIVGASPTGAWTGKAGQLAYWLTSTNAWQFIVPNEGFRFRVNDENLFYYYDGSAWFIEVSAISVKDEGTLVGTPSTLNFVGSNVTVTDAGSGQFDVTITGGASDIAIPVFLGGLQTANALVQKVLFQFDVEFPANFAGSGLQADFASTASKVYDVRKNGTSIGSITVAASGTTGTFTTVGGTAKTFTTGDRLEITTPAVQDTTLADVSITLMGTRT